MTDATLPPQRDLFRIPDDVCYLNCAYMSPQLEAASAAGRESVELKAQPWRLTEEHWFERVETARRRFASLLGARSDDIALVPSASYAIASAAQNSRVEPGERILLLAEQFPSCVYPWQRKANACGGEIVSVPRPADRDWTAAVLAHLDRRCAVVALPAFHWADGGRLDLVEIGAAARSVGATLVVDLSQSAGAAVFDLARVDPDWLCAPAYKWLLGPYSTGFLYVAPRHQGGVPLEENWIARTGSEDFSRLVEYEDAYRPGARRFDVGERSNFVLLPMLNAGLDQILTWRVERIEASLRATCVRIAEIAERLGFEPLPAALRAPHIIGLTRHGGLPAGLVDRLRERSVYVGTRGNAMRVAPHLHVDDADLERFHDALGAIVAVP